MNTYFKLTPIPANQLQKMSSERLFNHTKTLRAYEASFRCGCCGMWEWNIYPEAHEDGRLQKEYNILKEYLQSVWDIINERGDLNDVVMKSRRKHDKKVLRGKNKGHQKLIHSKRKKSQ